MSHASLRINRTKCQDSDKIPNSPVWGGLSHDRHGYRSWTIFKEHQIVLCEYIYHTFIEYATLSWYKMYKTDSDLDLKQNIEGKIVDKSNKNNCLIFFIVTCDCQSKYRVSTAQWLERTTLRKRPCIRAPFFMCYVDFFFRSEVNMTRARPRKLCPSSVRRSGRASVHPGTWTTSRTNSRMASSSAN